MVPSPAEQELLSVLQAAWSGQGPEQTAAQKRVPELVNQPGSARLLFEVLRTGEAVQAQTAAFGLLHARSELVRRQLLQLARELPGERRLAAYAALTPEELQQHIESSGDFVRSQLIASSGVLAMNGPNDFVEITCESGGAIGLSTLEEIESMRRRWGIGASSVYEPLLARPLTRDALARVAEILGEDPGSDVKRVLRRAISKARDESVRRMFRREQLRHASLAIGAPVGARRDGVAFLQPLSGDSRAALSVYERVRDGEQVCSSVTWQIRGIPEFSSLPIVIGYEAAIERDVVPERDARMTLGQARTLLESFLEAHQRACAPVLARLSDIPPESVPIPAPGRCFTAEEAELVLASPVWESWRPFSASVREGMSDEAQLLASHFQRRAGAIVLAEGLRHMAFVMSLRGDAAAASVLAEAIWVARKRISPLMLALARSELRRS